MNRMAIIKICSIVIISIIIILLIVNVFLTKVGNKGTEEDSIKVEVENIINRLGSSFISINPSEENNFEYDIYINFKEDLYKNDKSNEVLYTNLITQVESFLKTNIRLIDTSKNLIIRVTYVKRENKYYYTINGESDYFIKHDSLNNLKNYSEYENVDIRVNSDLLIDIINNNWVVSNDILGTKESIFEDYEIYFDEGYQIKKSGGKIFNIIFNKKYKDKIANNVRVTDNFERIKKAFGEPIFSYENVIGYKNEDMYIFFHNDEVSIYRNEKYDCEEFENLLDKYIQKEIDIKEFINELTYLWNDYARYSYDSSYVDLQYANQGVGIYLSDVNQIGVTIYNNYSSIETIAKYIQDSSVKADFQDDAVFKEEKNRISTDEQRCQVDLNRANYIGSSSNFVEKVKDSKVEFYSRNEIYPSCRLLDNVNSYFWYDDNIFVYSVQKKGIYYFVLDTQESFEILSGNDNYKFNNYEDGIINYDDNKTLEIGSE